MKSNYYSSWEQSVHVGSRYYINLINFDKPVVVV